MFAELVQTARKKENSYVSTLPLLKFISCLGILLTFLVFNILLAGEATRDPALNFKVNSVLFHVIIPIMYIADWILFYEHKKVKWNWPIISAIFPLAYAIFVFLHAWAYKFDATISNWTGTGSFIYPYFFLNLEKLGIAGVLKWVGILAVGFIVFGYIFYGIAKLLQKHEK